MKKSKLIKTISMFLIIFMLMFTIISSYQKAEAFTLTAAIIAAAKLVIPTIATIISYNLLKNTNEFQSICSSLETRGNQLCSTITSVGLLSLLTTQAIKNGLNKSAEDYAPDLGITNPTEITKAQNIANKISTGTQDLTKNEICDMGLDNVIANEYVNYMGNIIYFVNSQSFSADDDIFIINYNQSISSILRLISLFAITSNTTSNIGGKCKFRTNTQILDNNTIINTIYLINSAKNITMNIVKTYTSLTNIKANGTTTNTNDLTLSNVHINMYYGNTNTLNTDINSTNFRTVLVNLLANVLTNYSDAQQTTILDDLCSKSMDYYFKDFINVNIAKETYIDVGTIGLDIPTISSGTICSDDVWDIVLGKPEDLTKNIDIQIGASGTIGLTGNPSIDNTDTPVPESQSIDIPDVSNPPSTNIGEGTGEGTGEGEGEGGTGEGTGDTGTGILSWLKSVWEALKELLKFTWLKNLIESIIQSLQNFFTEKSGIDWGNFKGFFDIFYIIIFLILIAMKIFIKLLQVVASLLTVEASSAFFDQYPNILAGINYLKGITVPGINVTLWQCVEYMIYIFFVIYILKIIQAIYHAFVKQENLELHQAEKDVRNYNRELEKKERKADYDKYKAYKRNRGGNE